jgi:hypothetical protein
VLVYQLQELLVGPEAAILLLTGKLGEVVAQCGEPDAVTLLEADDRSETLAFGNTLGAFDPSAPGQLIAVIEAMEGGEAGIAAESPRERAAGPYERRIAGERTEKAVDEIDYSRFGCPWVLIGRNQSGTCRLNDRVLVLVKESSHERVYVYM